MRWIGNDGQVAFLFYNRNSAYIHGITRSSLECPNTAFAEYHVLISARKYVFCRHQPFFNCCGETAFEHHRLRCFAEVFEKHVILHVPCTYLENVCVLFHQIDLTLIHHFRDDFQFVFIGCLAQEF